MFPVGLLLERDAMFSPGVPETAHGRASVWGVSSCREGILGID